MMRKLFALLLASMVSLCAMTVMASSALAEDASESYALSKRWYIEGQISMSIITDKIDTSMFAETFGFSVTAGYGVSKNMMIIITLEQNNWKRNEHGGKWDPGVFNAGVGMLYQVFAPHIFIRASAGTSTLTFNSPLDSAGETGAYIDFVPVEIHWQPIDDLILALRPLSIHFDAPVISDPGIHYVQYRTSFSVGYLF